MMGYTLQRKLFEVRNSRMCRVIHVCEEWMLRWASFFSKLLIGGEHLMYYHDQWGHLWSSPVEFMKQITLCYHSNDNRTHAGPVEVSKGLLGRANKGFNRILLFNTTRVWEQKQFQWSEPSRLRLCSFNLSGIQFEISYNLWYNPSWNSPGLW